MFSRADDYPVHQTADPIAVGRRRAPQFLRPLLLQRLQRATAASSSPAPWASTRTATSPTPPSTSSIAAASTSSAPRAAPARERMDTQRRSDRRRGAGAAAHAARGRRSRTPWELSADLVVHRPRRRDRGAALPPRASTATCSWTRPGSRSTSTCAGGFAIGGETIELTPERTGARATAPGAFGRSASAMPDAPSRRRSSSGCGRRCNFDDLCTHFDVNEGADGDPLARGRHDRAGRRRRRAAARAVD